MVTRTNITNSAIGIMDSAQKSVSQNTETSFNKNSPSLPKFQLTNSSKTLKNTTQGSFASPLFLTLLACDDETSPYANKVTITQSESGFKLVYGNEISWQFEIYYAEENISIEYFNDDTNRPISKITITGFDSEKSTARQSKNAASPTFPVDDNATLILNLNEDGSLKSFQIGPLTENLQDCSVGDYYSQEIGKPKECDSDEIDIKDSKI